MSEQRCPCGEVILADTEDWDTPLCYDCWYDLDEANRDGIKYLTRKYDNLKAHADRLAEALKEIAYSVDADDTMIAYKALTEYYKAFPKSEAGE